MAVRIGLGMTALPFSDGRAFWRWVEACEDGGVDSLWQSDRLVSEAPFLECLTTLAALAGGARRMKFGMNVLALGLREPVAVAKACATIDFLSSGRLLPAFGIGAATSPDWAATGISPKGQGARTDEALEIIGRLWRGETVDFEGEHFQTSGARISPLPVQNPMPLWIGGSSPAAIRRTVRFANGWLAGLEPISTTARVVSEITAAAEAAGRPMDREHFGAGFFYRFGRDDHPAVETQRQTLARMGRQAAAADVIAAGDASAIIERVRAFQAAGITKFILRPLAEGEADAIEQTRLLTAEVFPEVHGR